MMQTMASREKTILIVASYEKGHEFVRTCKREGWRVVLLTSASLEGQHKWPTDAIDELFYMRDQDKVFDPGFLKAA